MQNAETVLNVLRERGRRGLPCDELYRQLFNPQLYLLAYGRLYSNKGAMTPGADGESVDGMSQAVIDRIIDAMRHERYRFQPVRRVYNPEEERDASAAGPAVMVRRKRTCSGSYLAGGPPVSRPTGPAARCAASTSRSRKPNARSPGRRR